MDKIIENRFFNTPLWMGGDVTKMHKCTLYSHCSLGRHDLVQCRAGDCRVVVSARNVCVRFTFVCGASEMRQLIFSESIFERPSMLHLKLI